MKTRLVALLSLCVISVSPAQEIKGTILSTVNNLTVVKVWGTHHERGYATGYLLAPKIRLVIEQCWKRILGDYYPSARAAIQDTTFLWIDPIYKEEAQGVAEGMVAVGVTGYDAIDVLVSSAIVSMNALGAYHCSTLIDWGDATATTSLLGRTVAAHIDDYEAYGDLVSRRTYIENQVMMIHVPDEPNEQPWLNVDYAGALSAHQGVNNAGLCIFDQSMNEGKNGIPQAGMRYEPERLVLRTGLERKDFNGDGHTNAEDFKDLILGHPNGFPTADMFAIAAPSTEVHDSLVALIAETNLTKPYYVFRSTAYDDTMPGKNLYTANSGIATNDIRFYCYRYLGVAGAIGSGTNIDTSLNWALMRDYSIQKGIGIVFMQVVPEEKVLRVAVRTVEIPVYQMEPMTFNLDTLFSPTTDVRSVMTSQGPRQFGLEQNYPNPFNATTTIHYTVAGVWNQASGVSEVRIAIYDLLGREVAKIVNAWQAPGTYEVRFDGAQLTSGVYFYKLRAGNWTATRSMLLLK